jgi:hypothetical protein
MPPATAPLIFQQVHIEVARNATDDFNPFHDKNRWQRIEDNPFEGPIALGFQLEALIEHQVLLHRRAGGEVELVAAHDLHFSNYQFTFAGAVHAGQALEVGIKRSQLREGDNATLSNRVSLKADGQLVLLGYKRESRQPLVLPDADITGLGELEQAADRAFLPNSRFFLKRKFMTNSNAKNFLTGSLAEQADYFDELADRVHYPEIFPCALLSCALLEKALKEHHDFERNPMVYTSHRISIDRRVLARLRSNDRLHLLVDQREEAGDERHYECLGVVGSNALLFRAELALAPLAVIRRASA